MVHLAYSRNLQLSARAEHPTATGCRCEAARRLTWPVWWFSRQRSWRNSRPRRAESAHGTLASGGIFPKAGAFFLQNSHEELTETQLRDRDQAIFRTTYLAPLGLEKPTELRMLNGTTEGRLQRTIFLRRRQLMRQLRPNETHDVACRDVGCDMCEGECDDGDRTWTYQRKCAAVATCEMTQQRQSPVKFRQISVKFCAGPPSNPSNSGGPTDF